MTIKADSNERLVAAPEPPQARSRRRFIGLLVLCLLLHAALLSLLLYEGGFDSRTAVQQEEIPVELVAEMPPEPKPEPPPPPTPAPKKEPPPRPKTLPDEMKPAYDAPRDANNETVEREAPDKETQSPRVAPPSKQTAPQPAPEKSQAQVQETAPDPSPQHAPERAEEQKLEDKPDAEALDKAEKKEPAKSKDRQAKRDPVKTAPSQGRRPSVADQLAALSPAPSYSVGSAAKAAPVGGGTEKSTYLSILYGLIMRHWHDPTGSQR